MSRFVWAIAAMVALFVASAPQVALSQMQDQLPMILPVDPSPLTFESATGVHNFTIEVAGTAEERSAGLMFRTDMDGDHGMLFVFEQTHRPSFWMKNTPMPLDLIFIDEDGRVAAIRWGQPFSTAPISPLAQARFVLELKAGTAQEAGIAEGDRVRHPRIDEVAGAN